MIDARETHRGRRDPEVRPSYEPAPPRTELWRLRGGAMGDLCAVVIETSVGWAVGLALGTELLEQYLEPDLDGVEAEAARLKAMFAGWPLIDEEGGRKEDA